MQAQSNIMKPDTGANQSYLHVIREKRGVVNGGTFVTQYMKGATATVCNFTIKLCGQVVLTKQRHSHLEQLRDKEKFLWDIIVYLPIGGGSKFLSYCS